MTVVAAPAKFHWNHPDDPGHVTAEEIAASPTEYDKVMLLGLGADAAGATITVHELDVRTGIWGASVTTHPTNASHLAADVLHALWNAFSPLVRLDEIGEQGVTARIRGGGFR